MYNSLTGSLYSDIYLDIMTKSAKKLDPLVKAVGKGLKGKPRVRAPRKSAPTQAPPQEQIMDPYAYTQSYSVGAGSPYVTSMSTIPGVSPTAPIVPAAPTYTAVMTANGVPRFQVAGQNGTKMVNIGGKAVPVENSYAMPVVGKGGTLTTRYFPESKARALHNFYSTEEGAKYLAGAGFKGQMAPMEYLQVNRAGQPIRGAYTPTPANAPQAVTGSTGSVMVGESPAVTEAVARAQQGTGAVAGQATQTGNAVAGGGAAAQNGNAVAGSVSTLSPGVVDAQGIPNSVPPSGGGGGGAAAVKPAPKYGPLAGLGGLTALGLLGYGGYRGLKWLGTSKVMDPETVRDDERNLSIQDYLRYDPFASPASSKSPY